MSSRPPYFAFYPGDFAGDINVEAMTTLQVGAYILLLCKAWQADPPASLPNDDAILARFARLSPAEWSAVKAGVLAPFTLGTDDRWHQKRLRREYETARSLIRKREQAGAAGAAARWQSHGKRMAEPLRPQCDGNANQNQNQNQKKKEDKTPPTPRGGGRAAESDPRFKAFWEQYPRKAAKPKAAAAFAKIDPDPAALAAMLAALDAAKRSDQWRRDDGQYIPHPTTWLNQRRWEDTPPEVSGPIPGRRHVDRTTNYAADTLLDIAGAGQ